MSSDNNKNNFNEITSNWYLRLRDYDDYVIKRYKR